MELVKPDLGLLFWMLLTFSIILFILGKFAWKPILKSLKDREESIEGALRSADKVKEEMAAMQSKNEELIKMAQGEREQILRDARAIREKTISDAKEQATVEADRIVASARENIQNEKTAAIIDLKNQIASLSLEIAEKVIKNQLEDPNKQKGYIDDLLKDVDLN